MTQQQGDTFPGDNQDRVLPEVVVGATSPNWALDKFGAGEVELPKDEDSGTVCGEIDQMNLKVPGVPHYGMGMSDSGAVGC